jgi:hypothetical protein
VDEEVLTMTDVETALREVMHERATEITGVPDFQSLTMRRGQRAGRGLRRTTLAAVVAAVAVGGSVALSQMVEGPTITPVSDQFVVASGEVANGPWKLTAYWADVEVPARTVSGVRYEVRKGWCLDLDAPSVDSPGASPTQYANVCSFETEGVTTQPIGSHGRIPDFRADDALVYGEVSHDVTSLELLRRQGLSLQATIVRSPQEWDLPVDYFFAFVPGSGRVDAVARGQNGDVLEESRI